MSIHKLRTDLGHYFKYVLFFLVLIFAISGAFMFGGNLGDKSSRGSQAGDAAIAKANGIDITRGEFDTMWLQYTKQAEQQGMQLSPMQCADVRASLFQNLVQSKLMLAEAKRLGVDISESKIDETVDKNVAEYLKADRRQVLGNKLSKQQEATDPRQDSAYIEELSRNELSITQVEEQAKSMLPRDQIASQIAIQGLQQLIKSKTAPVTDADVNASYNTYKITQIVIDKLPGAPSEQLKAKADKYYAEVTKPGADFNAIAKEANKGGSAEKAPGAAFSFETRNVVAPEVRDLLAKMKPGAITPVVSVANAYMIIKLDSMVSKLPAKFDKKTVDARRKEIEQDRFMTVAMKFQTDMDKSKKVEVIDPEMKAYWLLGEAQRSMMTDFAKYKQNMAAAEAALKDAAKRSEGVSYTSAKLAQLYMQQNKFADASALLKGMINTQRIANAEVYMMYGDCLVKQNENEEAIKNYQEASAMSKNDPNITQQLQISFTKLGRKDLAAVEQAKLADYAKRRAAFEEMMKKQQGAAPTGKPVSNPAPNK